MSLFDLDVDTDTGMMSRHDPKQIRARQFARVRRGFDPEQVRAFLDEVATQMEQAVSELRFAQEEAEAAARRGSPDPYTQLGSRVAELVRGAEEHAARVREEAQEQAQRQVSEADDHAERTKQEVEAHAKQVRSEAQAAAERVRSEAAAEADRTTQEASTEADRVRREAQDEAGRLREQARAALENATAEAEAAVAELKEARDRLFGDIQGAREGFHLALARLDEALDSIGPKSDDESDSVPTDAAEDEGEPAALTEAPPSPVEQVTQGEQERPLKLPSDLPPLPDLWEFTAQLERGGGGEPEPSGEPEVGLDQEDQPPGERHGVDPKDIDIQIPDLPLIEDRKDGPGPP
jgi:DivIVA domain-containing protein